MNWDIGERIGAQGLPVKSGGTMVAELQLELGICSRDLIGIVDWGIEKIYGWEWPAREY